LRAKLFFKYERQKLAGAPFSLKSHLLGKKEGPQTRSEREKKTKELKKVFF
jgi:hypothetical protein